MVQQSKTGQNHSIYKLSLDNNCTYSTISLYYCRQYGVMRIQTVPPLLANDCDTCPALARGTISEKISFQAH